MFLKLKAWDWNKNCPRRTKSISVQRARPGPARPDPVQPALLLLSTRQLHHSLAYLLWKPQICSHFEQGGAVRRPRRLRLVSAFAPNLPGCRTSCATASCAVLLVSGLRLAFGLLLACLRLSRVTAPTTSLAGSASAPKTPMEHKITLILKGFFFTSNLY